MEYFEKLYQNECASFLSPPLPLYDPLPFLDYVENLVEVHEIMANTKWFKRKEVHASNRRASVQPYTTAIARRRGVTLGLWGDVSERAYLSFFVSFIWL